MNVRYRVCRFEHPRAIAPRCRASRATAARLRWPHHCPGHRSRPPAKTVRRLLQTDDETVCRGDDRSVHRGPPSKIAKHYRAAVCSAYSTALSMAGPNLSCLADLCVPPDTLAADLTRPGVEDTVVGFHRCSSISRFRYGGEMRQWTVCRDCHLRSLRQGLCSRDLLPNDALPR